MKLLVCILNWRTPELTLRAVEKVVPQLRLLGDARLCVVDNASGDASFERIQASVEQQGFSDVTEVVQSGFNGGFGYGNNVALRRAFDAGSPPDLFYLLNSDAFPHPGALETLVRFMDDHASVGICGSLVRGLDGEPEASAFRFPSAWSELERSARLGPLSRALGAHTVRFSSAHDAPGEVDWVAGASMLIRRPVLEQVGLFDEAYFLYYEETDLCWRARQAGWRVSYVRTAAVSHVGGASTGVQHRTRVERPMPRYVFESRRHYFLKNHGRPALWTANAAYTIGGASFRLRRALQQKPDPERPREWWDWSVFNLTHP